MADAEKSILDLLKKRTSRVYYHDFVQGMFALTILANFLINIIETCLTDEHLRQKGVKDGLWLSDVVFTIIFTMELVLNMLCNWFFPFWKDGWNIFDFITVLFSLVALVEINLPSELNVLRSIKVFRAARLFAKSKDLKLIMNGILASLVPVLNTVFIFIIVTAMFAVIGKQLFYKDYPENFFNFSIAMFSMYQVATGDGWAGDIARPIVFHFDETGHVTIDSVAYVFFILYTVFASLFLLNVVVAVLLDKFTQSQSYEEDQSALSNWAVENYNSLDPLLHSLACIDTRVQLQRTLGNLFRILADQGSALTFVQMHLGLKSLPFNPRIYFTKDDWDSLHGHEVGTDSNSMSCDYFIDSLDRLHHQYLRKRSLRIPLLIHIIVNDNKRYLARMQ